jgi:Helix-turn-helix domain
MRLAQDLPATWNAPTADARARQRLTRTLIQEMVIDLDNAAHEAVLLIHGAGGRHSEVRVARIKTERSRAPAPPSPVDVIRRLAPEWPDRQIAITLNRVHCAPEGAETWTTLSVREVRERPGIAECPTSLRPEATLSVQEAARRLGICVGSVHRLIREGSLSATQAMWAAPWKVPTEALATDRILEGVRDIKSRHSRILE